MTVTVVKSCEYSSFSQSRPQGLMFTSLGAKRLPWDVKRRDPAKEIVFMFACLFHS